MIMTYVDNIHPVLINAEREFIELNAFYYPYKSTDDEPTKKYDYKKLMKRVEVCIQN